MALIKSIDVESTKGVYIYTPFYVNEPLILFAKRCKYSVLTIEKSIFDKCIREKINVLLAPKSALKFKKFLKNKQISLILLYGDNYHGRFNYLARNYPSAFMQGVSWNTYEFYQTRAKQKDSPTYLRIYKLLSLTFNLFGQDKMVYDPSIKGLFSALKQKIIWGLRNESYLHGSFCDLIFLQSELEKKIWVENLFSHSKIHITGSLVADFFVEEARIAQNELSDEKISCDLLFFSQPFPLYPEYKKGYLNELQQVVNKCSEMNLNMIIKLHPRDDISFYKKFENNNCRVLEHSKKGTNSQNMLLSNNQNLSLIKDSKVIMGKGSTSLLNAILMGKPVIFLDIMDSKLVHYKRYTNLKLLLTNINKFEKMYNYSLNRKNKDRIHSQQMHLLDVQSFYDGQSWKRIKEQVDLFLLK